MAAEYLASLHRLSELDVEWVLNAHGRPRPDGKAVIAGVLARFWELTGKVGQQNLHTPHHVASELYRQTPGPFELRMAVFEVLSLMRYSLPEAKTLAA